MKTKLRKGIELVHKKSGKVFRITEIEYTAIGKLPGDSVPRQLYMNKKELLFYFDIKADDEDLFG